LQRGGARLQFAQGVVAGRRRQRGERLLLAGGAGGAAGEEGEKEDCGENALTPPVAPLPATLSRREREEAAGSLPLSQRVAAERSEVAG
jgi:hypothetical protein